MLKKAICCLCILASICFCSCSLDIDYSSKMKRNNEEQDMAKLIINGIDVECPYTLSINRTKEYAELPLVLIIQSLGG